MKQDIMVTTQEESSQREKLENFLKLKDFLSQNERGVEIEPHFGYFDKTLGMSERMRRIVTEHFGSSLPVVHFTNAAVGKKVDDLVSTGFVENFIRAGSEKNTHIGAFRYQETRDTPFIDMNLEEVGLVQALEKARQIGEEFHHHGRRTNKLQLGLNYGARYSLPALVVMEKPDALEKGPDNYDHWIIPSPQGPDKIITIILLTPEVAFTRPYARSRKTQNEFLTQVIHGLGLYRLNQIHQMFLKTINEKEQERLALYAHDLVDAYLISKEDYMKAFDTIDFSDEIKMEIRQREEDYSFFDKE